MRAFTSILTFLVVSKEKRLNKGESKEGKEDKTSGKAKEVVDNAKEKANDVIDKFKGDK